MQEDDEDKEICENNMKAMFKDTPFVLGNVLRVYDRVFFIN